MKILAFMNSLSLGHMSRVLEVARVLRAKGHDIVIAGSGDFMHIFTEDKFKVLPLPYVQPEQIKAATHKGEWDKLYPYDQISKFIQAECELIKQEKPDLILIDYRPTARTSADIYKVPTVALLNVHMSMFRKHSLLQLGHKFGPNSLVGKFLTKLLIPIEDFFYNHFMLKALNKIRKEKGLNPLYSHQHDQGDLTLLADNKVFNPTNKLKNNVAFVGPLVWHNNLPISEEIKKLNKNKKTIYWNIGSIATDSFIELLQKMKGNKYQFIITTGINAGTENLKPADGIVIEPLANMDAILPYCDLVCCHGGNGTIYQALSHGLPVLGLSQHDEQYYNLLRVNELKLGRGFSPAESKKMSFEQILKYIDELLADTEIKKQVELLKPQLQLNQSAQNATHEIESFYKNLIKPK